MATSYWRRRIIRHALLALVSAVATAMFYWLWDPPDPKYKLSIATAYVGLALLAATLAVGPYQVLRGQKSPLSTDLRRDVGIWAALVSLLHFVVGLNRHMVGRPWLFFVEQVGKPPTGWRWRRDLFGFSNYTGLVAVLILVLLLALSNDLSLRRLGRRKWKSLQRWSYAGIVLTVAHAVGYQISAKRSWAFVVVLASISVFILATQIAGIVRFRSRARATAASPDGT